MATRREDGVVGDGARELLVNIESHGLQILKAGSLGGDERARGCSAARACWQKVRSRNPRQKLLWRQGWCGSVIERERHFTSVVDSRQVGVSPGECRLLRIKKS